jgi:hypothetical protein
VVSWKTNLHYRGGHGRSYLGGIPTAARVSNQLFTTTFTSALQTSANAFLTAVNAHVINTGNNSQLCILQRFRGMSGIPPKPTPLNPPIVSPVTTAVVHSRVDTQRRRLGKFD